MTAVQTKPQATGTATVVVGCRHPLGFVLTVHKAIERFEPVIGGGSRPYNEYMPDGPSISIHGTAREPGKDPKAMVRNGAALTFGIPKDFWDRWKAENKGSPLLENGILFEESTADRAAAKAKEFNGMRTGLEPLNPDGDKRIPKSTNPAVSKAEKRTDDE